MSQGRKEAHEHCWHEDPNVSAPCSTESRGWIEVCCHCGARQPQTGPWEDLSAHGNHYPTQTASLVRSLEASRTSRFNVG